MRALKHTKKWDVKKVIFLSVALCVIGGVIMGATVSQAWHNDKKRIQILNQQLQDLQQQNEDLKHRLKVAEDAITFNPSNLLEYSNASRTSAGLRPLALNEVLNKSAKAKAEDMVAKNYWSHDTPDGSEPWIFVQRLGYAYLKLGENLAFGFDTGQQTINGWMKSPTHRENMLDQRYTEVGFGVIRNTQYQFGVNTIVVAHYGTPRL